MRRRRLLAALAVLAVAPLAGAFVPRPLFPPAGEAESSDARRILVLANPIHTDIALPADEDIRGTFSFLADGGLPLFDPAVEWIIVGWGGREFYLQTPTWSELKPGPVLRALTIDRSVMHVALAGEINSDAEGVTPVDLSPAAFEKMVDAISISFARDGAGRVSLIEGAAYGDYDRFYEAVGWFNAFAGCNTWTGAVLREAGLRTGAWNPLPQSLVWSLEAFNELL